MASTVRTMRRRCLVVGGSGALGTAICRVLAREGCDLALTFHTRGDRAESVAHETEARIALRCDVRNAADVASSVDKAAEVLGGLDAVIHAAGTSGDARFYQRGSVAKYDYLGRISQADFDDVMDVNAKSSLAVCQAAHPFLKASKGGNLVLIGSMDGVKPVPSPVHFAMSKASLRGLVESAAKELGQSDIRINLIAPGILQGGASQKLSEDFLAPYLKHCGLRRLGTMDEAAEVVSWFALENTYVTGQCILLDGGL